MTTPPELASQTLVCSPGPKPEWVRVPDGRTVAVPAGWELLPPGDAGLTRRVKAAGPTWAVQEKRGRKVFSRGLWADAQTIARIKAELEAERAKPQYARKLAQAAVKREVKQTAYVEDFAGAVSAFLRFAPVHAELANRLAAAVTAHATPVGSGTVARTERIPIEERAEAAVIAWMRHQTTAYDTMRIARVKGERREVRRELAKRSHSLLARYRRGEPASPDCPLAAALMTSSLNPDAASGSRVNTSAGSSPTTTSAVV